MDVSLILTQMSIEEILRIIYEAIPVSIVMKDKIVAYDENEYVDDIKSKILNTRFRCYPVANEEGKLVGSISRYHVFNHKKKEFILGPQQLRPVHQQSQ